MHRHVIAALLTILLALPAALVLAAAPTNVYIPIAEVPSLPIATPPPTTPLPAGLVIDGANAIPQNGALTIYGVVWNNTGTTKDYVQVTARLYDVNNRVVATGTGDTHMTRTYHGGKYGFAIQIPNAPAYVRYELTATSKATSRLEYRTFGLFNTGSKYEYGVGYQVFGELKNHETVPLKDVKVAMIYTFPDGRIMYADAVYATDRTLLPGETTTFRIIATRDLYMIDGNYEIQTEAYLSTGEADEAASERASVLEVP